MHRFLGSALATCAALAAGPALAQTAPSSVTLYGVIDNNIGWGQGSVSSNKQVGTGGYLGSRLGVRGVEDLGGGLKASFLMEHGLNSVTGTAAGGAVFWNRQAFVALSGGFGELALGRQYTPTFLVHASYDIFGPQGVAAQQVLFGSVELAQAANIRADNAVSYKTPANLGGFSLQAMATDHTAATPGWYHGVKLGYAGGPVSADLAFGRYNNPAIGSLSTVTGGVRMGAGPFKAALLFDRANSGSGPDSSGLALGGSYTAGATEYKLSVGRSSQKSALGTKTGTTTRFGAGFVHALSKRSFVYGQVAQLNNGDGARMAVNGAVTAANQRARGLDLGFAHSF